MKVFIGSSREQERIAEDVARWLEGMGVDVLVWNEPEAFIPGRYTLDELVRLSRTVDAAVFVFAADDKLWYRKDLVTAVRDNVLFEYGLFCGAISREKVLMLTIGDPKLATDLNGITTISLGDKARDAKKRLGRWVEHVFLPGEKVDYIDCHIGSLKTFDEKGYEDQIYTLKDVGDGWTEIIVDYSNLHGVCSAFSGVYTSKERGIDIAESGNAMVELAFLDNNLERITLEFKNKKNGFEGAVDIKPEMISNDMCSVDISCLSDNLLRNIDEVVFCTKPGHFMGEEKVGRYKIKSVSFI